jgi:hypothetical protein
VTEDINTEPTDGRGDHASPTFAPVPPTRTEAHSGARVKPELAANWYATRLHYSEDLKAQGMNGVLGRTGHGLCSTDRMPVDVYDQTAHEWYWERSGAKGKSFAGLPLCKKCEKKVAGRLGVSR